MSSWLGALGLGAALRLDQISLQTLVEDELHALHAVRIQGYQWIATHFGEADHCIPLTLLYEWTAGTVGLTELRMRAPMLIVGILAPLVLPLLLPPRPGSREVRHAFAWLLAISPLHVYFSRYARPYGLAMVAAFAALLAFQRWWSGGRRRWGGLYAGCAILGPWLHLTVLPFSLAPLLLALASTVVPGAARASGSWKRALGMGCLVAVGLAALLSLPLFESWTSIAEKLGSRHPDANPVPETFLGAARLLVGTQHLWLLAAVVAVALVGAIQSAREERVLVASIAISVLLHSLVLVASRPVGIDSPMVLVRYSVTALPILLLFEARGWVGVGKALRHWARHRLTGLPLVAGCALLLGFGPLRDTYYRPNNWTNHPVFQYEYDEDGPFYRATEMRPARIPRFYQELGRLPPGSVLILEAPWDFHSDQNPFPYYQRVHRQPMKVGLVGDRLPGPQFGLSSAGFRFAQFVSLLDDARLRREEVAYVVFHKDLWAETPSPRPGQVNVLPWIGRYHRRYGPPSYEDDWIVVFDLRRHSRPRQMSR